MLTGDEYKASLDDGRSTYFEGEKVTDLAGHPVLGTVVQNVADGYDWLALKAVDGVSPVSGIPTTPDQLREKVELVHTAGMMAHVTYTSLMTLTTAAGRLAETGPRVRRADPGLRRRRPAARHPDHPVHHRRQGRPRRSARASRTTPTPTSASSTAAPTAW